MVKQKATCSSAASWSTYLITLTPNGASLTDLKLHSGRGRRGRLMPQSRCFLVERAEGSCCEETGYLSYRVIPRNLSPRSGNIHVETDVELQTHPDELLISTTSTACVKFPSLPHTWGRKTSELSFNTTPDVNPQ